MPGLLKDLPRHVLDALREGCQVIGRDYTYLYLNDAAAQQGHRSRAELLGHKMTEVYPGIDQTPFWQVLLRAMEGTAHEQLENLFTYPDGTTGVFELRFVPVPEGVFILSLDLTARKAADESRLLLAAAMEQAGEAIYITDAQGTIQYVNPAFERITGYGHDEALGKNPRILKSGEHGPLFYEAMWLTLKEGKSWRGRMTNRRKDGTTYLHDATVSPVHDTKGEVVSYVAVSRDLSGELKLEAHLQQVQRLESIGRLAGGIAHDFNNLLFVIQSYSDVLLETLPKDSIEHQDVQEIHDAGKRAVDLVHQLLAFSRKQVMRPVALDLNATVKGMETLLRRVLGEDIELTVALAPDLGVTLADPSQVEQVVMNLAVNARDAMPLGGQLHIATANVDIDEHYAEQHLTVVPGPYVLVSVADTGSGIDEATKARLFEPFFTTKPAGVGTGLGLATVYGIVKQSGGNIWVYTEMGKGTTFKIYLPRIELRAAQRTPERISAPRARVGESVLVVEDEPAVRTIAARILKLAGYEVYAAASREEAVQICRKLKGIISLILTDVIMPGMSGRDLAAQLLDVSPGIKVLYMSGYTDEAIQHQGVLEPGTAFISKPFSAGELTRKVREVLEGTGPNS